VAQEFFILLVTKTIVDEDKLIAIFNQKTTHGPCAEVLIVSGICFLPDGFGHDAKHGTTVEFEKTCFYYVKFHSVSSKL
jgi:hypothetical protein